MDRNIEAVNQAIKFLRDHKGSPKILVKQIRNAGDSIHMTIPIHHYRIKYPNAAIAFIVGQWYHNIHEHNPHINGLFLADHNATPQQRLQLWPLIQNTQDIDIKIIASIHPFGVVYPQNRWSLPCIADQYFYNAGITDLKPLGGRKPIIRITDDDRNFAKAICNRHKVNRLVIFECYSYSKTPVWDNFKFERLASILQPHGVKCMTIASSSEQAIRGTISCTGITWRQTTALLGQAKAMVGVGSGITMMAAAAEPQPRIVELGIPSSVSMNGCGYAPSISINDPTIEDVKTKILEVL